MWFLSLIVGVYDFWQKKSHGFKNCISRVHKIFLRKICFNKNLIPDFFEPSAENFSKFREVFSGLLSICNQGLQRSFLEEYMKFEINFDSLWHKFLAWVSFLLSTCPGEPLRKKMPQWTNFLPFFSSRKVIRFLRKFFSARLPSKQSMWLETFSHEIFFLRKLLLV